MISSILVSMTVSVFFSAARKAACLSATEWASNVRVSTFFPLGLQEMRSVPPAEEQPYDSQKQRGMMPIKDREESAVRVPFTC